MERDAAIVSALTHGQELFNRREFFAAHEAWEEAWSDTWGDERHLLQGLIQVAAALHKLQLGMPAGTVKLLEKSEVHLKAIPPDYYGVDVAALLPIVAQWRERARTMVEQWRTDFDSADLPTLSLTP